MNQREDQRLTINVGRTDEAMGDAGSDLVPTDTHCPGLTTRRGPYSGSTRRNSAPCLVPPCAPPGAPPRVAGAPPLCRERRSALWIRMELADEVRTSRRIRYVTLLLLRHKHGVHYSVDWESCQKLFLRLNFSPTCLLIYGYWLPAWSLASLRMRRLLLMGSMKTMRLAFGHQQGKTQK